MSRGPSAASPASPLSEVERYLTVGFVPSAARAAAYLDGLLSERAPMSGDAPQVLGWILHDRVYAEGHRDVVIPLTGGMDSRGLLGAALDVFEARAISCVTVGTASFPDCIVAAETCRRVGVRHERLETSTLRWDLDELVALARRRFERTDSCVTLETLVAFGAIGAHVGSQRPILSGYLGDALSGKHLPVEHGRLSSRPVETSFLAVNRSILDGRRSPELSGLFRDFAAANLDRLRGWPGATSYDLLDLGFRQSHYIRANSAAFPVCVRPYEDGRWVRHWLSRPLVDRLEQRAYLDELYRAFPSVFGARRGPASGPLRVVRRLVPGPLRRWIRHRQPGSALSVAANRGDPRTNATMAAAIEALLGAFDRRRLLPFSTQAALHRTIRRFDHRQFAIVQWAASAEVHLRAGTLGLPAPEPRRPAS
jgi:hypothetical protein